MWARSAAARVTLTQSLAILFPRPISSNATGFSAIRAAASSVSTNMCRCFPPSGTVAKILPRTRNDDFSKCGSSVVSGSDRANRRAASSLIRQNVPWLLMASNGVSPDRLVPASTITMQT